MKGVAFFGEVGRLFVIGPAGGCCNAPAKRPEPDRRLFAFRSTGSGRPDLIERRLHGGLSAET